MFGGILLNYSFLINFGQNDILLFRKHYRTKIKLNLVESDMFLTSTPSMQNIIAKKKTNRSTGRNKIHEFATLFLRSEPSQS